MLRVLIRIAIIIPRPKYLLSTIFLKVSHTSLQKRTMVAAVLPSLRRCFLGCRLSLLSPWRRSWVNSYTPSLSESPGVLLPSVPTSDSLDIALVQYGQLSGSRVEAAVSMVLMVVLRSRADSWQESWAADRGGSSGRESEIELKHSKFTLIGVNNLRDVIYAFC